VPRVSVESWETPWVLRRARLTPHAEALTWSGGQLNYRELCERAQTVALTLRALGVREGDVVGALVPNGPSAVVLIHALQLTGAVLLPLNLRLKVAELALQLRSVGARFLVHTADANHGRKIDARAQTLLAKDAALCGLTLRSGEDTRVSLAPTERGAGACDDPLCESTPLDRPLALLYTSGTTGRPRAVTLSAANFWHAAQASAAQLGCQPSERWLACMPLFHVGGLSIVFRSVLAGSSVLVHPGFDADVVAREFDADRVQLVSFVATMLQRVLDSRGARRCPPSLRLVLLGGGPTPVALLERARALGYPVSPTYGLTEACSQVATRPAGENRRPLDGRLQPLGGVELRIVDENGKSLRPGAEGEIQVRGPNVMAGYWRQPEETQRVLRDGWLATGDIGRLDRKGALQVLDRRTDLIVSGGENVYPSEVEAVLLEHPDVLEAAVVGVFDADFGARPVGCVVLRPRAVCDPEVLRSHCRAQLADYKVPARIEVRAKLPRTAAGKLRRVVLREELAKLRPEEASA
jgi:O-succinylbenzoic acid--CoA ligase